MYLAVIYQNIFSRYREILSKNLFSNSTRFNFSM